MLVRAQNQALRLITGSVKTTPVDVMLFTTGNKPIQELTKEKSVLLQEKLLRTPGDQYWKTYEDKPRNLKTENRFLQKVRHKSRLEIKSTNGEIQSTSNKLNITYTCNKT